MAKKVDVIYNRLIKMAGGVNMKYVALLEARGMYFAANLIRERLFDEGAEQFTTDGLDDIEAKLLMLNTEGFEKKKKT